MSKTVPSDRNNLQNGLKLKEVVIKWLRGRNIWAIDVWLDLFSCCYGCIWWILTLMLLFSHFLAYLMFVWVSFACCAAAWLSQDILEKEIFNVLVKKGKKNRCPDVDVRFQGFLNPPVLPFVHIKVSALFDISVRYSDFHVCLTLQRFTFTHSHTDGAASGALWAPASCPSTLCQSDCTSSNQRRPRQPFFKCFHYADERGILIGSWNFVSENILIGCSLDWGRGDEMQGG